MAAFYRKSEIPDSLLRFFCPAELGLEATPEEYVAGMVDVFREVWRVLRDDGTVWLNLGDCYNSGGGTVGGGKHTTNKGKEREPNYRETLSSMKPKDLVGIPWRVAFALQADGWYLRSDIIWSKPNPMPESVTDRPTKAHEYLFLLAKSERYYYDADAIREKTLSASNVRDKSYEEDIPGKGKFGQGSREWNNPAGRNKRSVWTIATTPYAGAHFATFPRALVEPCILAGSRPGDLVFDPFVGSGTTVMVARSLGRRSVGCDLAYQELSKERIHGPLFASTVNQ